MSDIFKSEIFFGGTFESITIHWIICLNFFNLR